MYRLTILTSFIRQMVRQVGEDIGKFTILNLLIVGKERRKSKVVPLDSGPKSNVRRFSKAILEGKFES